MGSRGASLLQLQRCISESGLAPDVDRQLAYLPFDAGRAQFVVSCREVERVLMPTDVVDLSGYAQLPECVIGIVATDSVMLSVIDGGLLFGRQRVVPGLKSRLLVFGGGPLKGVALLVDRVHARAATADGDRTRFDAIKAYESLQERAQAKRMVKQ